MTSLIKFHGEPSIHPFSHTRCLSGPTLCLLGSHSWSLSLGWALSMLTYRNQVMKTPAAVTVGRRNTESRGISALEKPQNSLLKQKISFGIWAAPFSLCFLWTESKIVKKAFLLFFSFFFELLLFSDLHFHQK